MKKIIPTCLGIIFSCTLVAQQNETVVYLDADGHVTKPRRAVFLLEKITQSDTCYEWNYYNSLGPCITSSCYKDPAGKILHGVYIHYNDTGIMDTTGTFFEGLREGAWQVYGPNRRILKELVYKNNVLTGEENPGARNSTEGNVIYPVEQVAAITGDSFLEADFKGGQRGWMMYLVHNLQYPQRAIDNNTSGSVLVRFIVDTTGTILEPMVYKSVDWSLDKEAIRIFTQSPSWVPAILRDRKIKSLKFQPLTFRLER